MPYYTLDKLPLAMSHRAVGREFKVNEPTIYIESGILQQKHTSNKEMY